MMHRRWARSRGFLICAASLVLVAACSDDTSSADAGVDARVDAKGPDAGADAETPDLRRPDTGCPSYAQPKAVGTVGKSAINEASGLVASRKQPGILWLHNDSGDSARIFAIDETGKHEATYKLSGVSAWDWEDIALGPGPDTSTDYLYAADIGDNPRTRTEIVIYRVAEPQVPAGGASKTIDLAGADALTFVYPDKAHDAETLLIDPRQGDLYVVTKDFSAVSQIFRAAAPHSAGGQPRTLEEVGKLGFRQGALADVKSGLLTAGDIAADGSAVLLRTYKDVLFFPLAAGQTIAAALAEKPCALPAAPEGQGETVAFSGSARAGRFDYFTLSEGAVQPLYRYVAQ